METSSQPSNWLVSKYPCNAEVISLSFQIYVALTRVRRFHDVKQMVLCSKKRSTCIPNHCLVKSRTGSRSLLSCCNTCRFYSEHFFSLIQFPSSIHLLQPEPERIVFVYAVCTSINCIQQLLTRCYVIMKSEAFNVHCSLHKMAIEGSKLTKSLCKLTFTNILKFCAGCP